MISGWISLRELAAYGLTTATDHRTFQDKNLTP